MAKRENRLKNYLLEMMGTVWDAQSHEDRFSLGIPDLSYGVAGVNGWIELKQVEKYPKKSSTPIDLKHFTPSQVNWLRKRGKRAGSCFILIQITTEYYIFSFHKARLLRAGMTKEKMEEQCIQKWENGIPRIQLLNVLIGDM